MSKQFNEITSNGTFDIRDVIERLKALREEREYLKLELEDASTALDEARAEHGGSEVSDEHPASVAMADAMRALEDFDDGDEGGELSAIEDFLEEVRGAGGDEKFEGEWYPVTFISDDEFEEHARELAEDCYEIPETWPHRCIDWKKAADELKPDYSTVDIDGNTFWFR